METVEQPNPIQEEKKSFASKYKWMILTLVTIVLLVVWYYLPAYMQNKIPDSTAVNIPNPAPAERGQYGDMYGVITSLFSGLTIIGLIFTIIQQQEGLRKQALELELTKQALINQQGELKNNRDEIIQNRNEIKLQHQTVKYQRFENTFFNMLMLLSGVKNKMNQKVTENLVANLSEMVKHRNGATYKQIYSQRVVQQINTELELIRNFEKTADLIYKEKEKDSNKKKYFGILCAQLTPDDLCVIYFHFLALAVPPEYFNEYKVSLLIELEAVGSRHTPYIELIKDIENGKL